MLAKRGGWMQSTINIRPLIPDLLDAIHAQDRDGIQETTHDWPAADLSEVLFDLPPTERVVLFRLLSHRQAVEVFSLLDVDRQNRLLEDLTSEETRELLIRLSPDDRTHLLEELPGQATQKLLNLLTSPDLEEARLLLGYPEGSVGRLMTPDYVAVRPDWPVQVAIDHTRRLGDDRETIDVLYVTDLDWHLIDALPLRRFILADPDKLVRDIMDNVYVGLSAYDDREEAVRAMERYDLAVLPVMDSDGILVGIVTFDDVMDVAEQEATEDFHRTAAVAPFTGNYASASARSLYRRRLPWLVILVFVNIFSGAVIASFEDTIAAAVALVFFLPLLIDSAGNAGAQASTLMIRALAVGDVRIGDWTRLMLRELGIATALGASMGIAVSWLGVLRGGTDVGIVVTITMVLVVTLGSMIGMTLPFVFSRLKWDPATASGPLITSLADISGVLIYFSLATWLLDV
jgi:magnesium transporter